MQDIATALQPLSCLLVKVLSFIAQGPSTTPYDFQRHTMQQSDAHLWCSHSKDQLGSWSYFESSPFLYDRSFLRSIWSLEASMIRMLLIEVVVWFRLHVVGKFCQHTCEQSINRLLVGAFSVPDGDQMRVESHR